MLAACAGKPTVQSIAATPSVVAIPAPPPAPAPQKDERGSPVIEPEAPSVVSGETTSSLKDVAVPFANYLVTVHSRIHPVFAKVMATQTKQLPQDGEDRVTTLEIVLGKERGEIVRIGVVRASGSTKFDATVLDTIMSAQPFGKPPEEILSPDGRVYVHWEFHRDPQEACALRNAFPYVLKKAP